eukprot:TCALIF_06321-PA protein Name:"Similar to rnf157 RING finger protein 157 (Xenopus laevis)" AED:0.15 eAED:0.15 QI:0/0/0/0.33/1/1/3/0/623
MLWSPGSAVNMGQTWSRSGRDHRREGDPDPSGVSGGGQHYRYPGKHGHPFFASHFIMGGEKFDSPQPESFLFGENQDLNLLGGRAVSFPYPPPAANEATKTLKSQINIRKDSVHLVLVPSSGDTSQTEATPLPPLPETPSESETDAENPPLRLMVESAAASKKRYRVQFTFDSDVRCEITIYYFCREENHAQGVTYVPKRSTLRSPTYTYNRGAAQVFNQADHLFCPADCQDELFLAAEDPELLGVAIQCVSLEGETPRTSHATVASIEANADATHFIIKNLKQKLFVDGLSYLLQEIYGLENKSLDVNQHSDDDDDDCGAECVVCMCDLRDTIILPCRHLCLCNACADSLRYQANNCPICRAPFRALLQIRAVQKIGQVTHPALPDPDQSQEGVPPGYQCVSLVEALNGPVNMSSAPSSQTAVTATTGKSPDKAVTSKSRKGSRTGRRSSAPRSASGEGRAHSPPRIESEAMTAEGEAETLSSGETAATTKIPPKLCIESEVTLRKSPSKRSFKGDASNPSLDLVDEELANMSLGQSSLQTKDNAAPGTPTSSVSFRSSQDSSSSSSSSSTKQLLPTTTTIAVAGPTPSSGVTRSRPNVVVKLSRGQNPEEDREGDEEDEFV